jgi:hypothetical protein
MRCEGTAEGREQVGRGRRETDNRGSLRDVLGAWWQVRWGPYDKVRPRGAVVNGSVTDFGDEESGALQCFREVTVKAPDFAEGLAYHALCLGSLGFWGHVPVREV